MSTIEPSWARTGGADPAGTGGANLTTAAGTDPAAAGGTRLASADTGGARWCDRCGGPTGAGPHDPCHAARELEPPRFCPACRRRMKVQVVPTGWTASCVEHGEIHG